MASDKLGYKTKKSQDWFNDNDDTISSALEAKQIAFEKLLSTDSNSPLGQKFATEYKEAKSIAQNKIRKAKDDWWSNMAAKAQAAADSKQTKAFYGYIHEVFGPTQTNIAPVRSKDDSVVFKDAQSIRNRWKEHYSELLNRESRVVDSYIEQVEQLPEITSLSDCPARSEVAEAVKALNTGKSPGADGLEAEILQAGGDKMIDLLHKIISYDWVEEEIPQEWIDATLVSLYKSGPRDQCGNFRGISLLSVVGKVLSRILLDRLVREIADNALPESQCGFRANRGTNDMIFTARQLQEKCAEQNLDLYHCFVDLSKAFDTVNREALWKVLAKCGCPPKFIKMLRCFHDGMQARINFGGDLSEPFPVENGVKQGDLAAAVLFAIYFAAMLQVAFRNETGGIQIRYRTDKSEGNVFKLARLRKENTVFFSLVRDLLYADDADLVSHSLEGLQSLVTAFDTTADAFGLTINQKKTVVMYQPAPGRPYTEPQILVKGSALEVVNHFEYLGSTLERTGSLDKEISSRIQKAAASFGNLDERVWRQRGISFATKIAVYLAFVLTALLYSSETWTVYAKHVKQLERFHQNCIRRILCIKWTSFTPDTDVLSKANIPSISALLLRSRLRWAGHLARLGDERLPKQMFYGELTEGKRARHKPKLRFKDCLKTSLKQANIGIDNWEDSAEDRASWRKLIYDGANSFESKRVHHAKVKRAARKGTIDDFDLAEESIFPCSLCSRVCLSKAGLKSHERSHTSQPATDYSDDVSLVCQVCQKSCRSVGGLKRHFNSIHKELPATQMSSSRGHICNICGFLSKSLSGLKSHLRAHYRNRAPRGGGASR